MAITDKLTAIADAIRYVTGETATMQLDEMPDKIQGISFKEVQWNQDSEAVKGYLDEITYISPSVAHWTPVFQNSTSGAVTFTSSDTSVATVGYAQGTNDVAEITGVSTSTTPVLATISATRNSETVSIKVNAMQPNGLSKGLSCVSGYVPYPATPAADTKPTGTTVDGVTYYNEIPNGDTPFASENVAGTLNPLDSVRWIKTHQVVWADGVNSFATKTALDSYVSTYSASIGYNTLFKVLYDENYEGHLHFYVWRNRLVDLGDTEPGANTRDLGGWSCDGGTVKYGMLFRGGETDPEDKDLMVNQIGIKHELQLRGKDEVIRSAGGRFYSVWDIDYTCPEFYNWMSLSNTTIWREVLRCIFDSINKYSQPVYFHCSAGADRTGTVAILIEALLGVSESDIAKDYELTCFTYGVYSSSTQIDTNSARMKNESEYQNYMTQINNVPLVGNLTSSFRNRVISFVLSLGFTAEEINQFRSNMIDGTPDKISFTPVTYSITKTLTHVTTPSTQASVDQYQPLVMDVVPAQGYVISSYSVKVNNVEVPGAFTGTKTDLYRSVKYNLVGCTTNNNNLSVIDGQSYAAVITASTGYTLTGATVTITVGGISMSEYYSNGTIAIPSVTGNVIISVTAVPQGAVNLYTGQNPELNKRITSSGVEGLNGAFITDFMEADCSNGCVLLRFSPMNPKTGTTNSYPYVERFAFYSSNSPDSTPIGRAYGGSPDGTSEGYTAYTVDGSDVVYKIGSSYNSSNPNAEQSYRSQIRYFKVEIRPDSSMAALSSAPTPAELSITVES